MKDMPPEPGQTAQFSAPPVTGLTARWRRWRNRTVASRGFQSWASQFPLTRRTARADGEALFDLVAGFVHSQVLYALVELDLLAALNDAPGTAAAIADHHRLVPHRAQALLNAAVALGLLQRVGDGYQTARLGAAVLGVPGLSGMIQHHDVFYRDLADPIGMLRGESDTELANFWPYVFGAGAAGDPDMAKRYSNLMTDSQALVAEETLRAYRFPNTRHLLDIGGGTGAFLRAVGAHHPAITLALFDLPAVVPEARERFALAGLKDRATVHPGSFRDDALPMGADTVSLIRVLYDHSDDTVLKLLASVYSSLQNGGTIVISEPMTGGENPHRAGDSYFAFYCMAMQTGRARSPHEINELMRKAGFVEIQRHRTHRPFVTSVVSARKT